MLRVSLLLGLVYLISEYGFQEKSNQESRNPGMKIVAWVSSLLSSYIVASSAVQTLATAGQEPLMIHG